MTPATALNIMLNTKSSITSVLGHRQGPTIPLIQYGVLPEVETALPCITFYSNSGDWDQCLRDYRFTINCYAETLFESEALAMQIMEEFNEQDSGVSGFFARTTCSIIGSIPDPTRNEVNTPIDFRIVNI